MNKDIAIIGISGIFPDAATLGEFYSNLLEGKDSVQKVSATRKVFSCIDQETGYKPGGFLERVDLFDYKFFKISRAEAEQMDPQQRLLMELTCGAMYNAGYSLKKFKGTSTGVFLAAGESGYSDHITPDANSMIGNLNAAIAGRIAYYFDLHGPAMMINTACSSSMIAVIEACNNLLLGNMDYAIAGGIKIETHFDPIDEKLDFDALESGDGKCKAFDQSADGVVGGEGGGVLILKLLETAIRDNDNIHAVIKGFAVNQDGGRKVGITAPSPGAQAEMLAAAWKRSGIDPLDISYIEAHGTGTKLGDPIEVKGLTDAFRKVTDKNHFCAIGSLKTNIGHLDSVAGFAGIIKTILSLKHKKIFRSLHFHNPNELIDFVNTAVYVNDKTADWVPACGKRIAGVSSFGISGTNAHLVLEEVVSAIGVSEDAARAARVPEELIFKFSARTPAALTKTIRSILHFVSGASGASGAELSLADLSYTLNEGRDDFSYREAIVTGAGKGGFIEVLRRLLEDRQAAPEEQPPSNRDLVLVFSGSEVPAKDLVRSLRDMYPAFREKWEECAGVEDPEASDNLTLFAFQLACHYLMKSFGISSNYRIGLGIGNIVIATLSGKLSLEQGLAEAKQYVQPKEGPDRNKLTAFLNKLNSPLVLELSPAGSIKSLLEGQSGIQVLDLSAGNIGAASGSNIGFSMPAIMAALYKSNIDIDWEVFYKQAKPGELKRIEAPGYPFERTRAWYADPLPLSGKQMDEWFYDLEWIARPSIDADSTGITAHADWMIFMDDRGIGEKLAVDLLDKGHGVIKVRFGEACERGGARDFVVRADREEDYIFLHDSLEKEGISRVAIIHLGNCIAAGSPVQEGPASVNDDAVLSAGLYSQFLLAKTFSATLSDGGTYAIVSLNAYEAAPADPVSYPGRSASAGFLRGLIAEYPAIRAKFIDLSADDCTKNIDHAALNIFRELGRDDHYICAYRKDRRFIQALRRRDATVQQAGAGLVENGVYLVTGGASGIGYAIGKEILAKTHSTLIIAGRTDLSAETFTGKDGNNVHAAEMAANLRQLAADGSDVQYMICDMGEEEQVKTLIDNIFAKYGRIDGIVHSAAAPGKKRIKNNTLAEFREILASRVQGTIALLEATNGRAPDFLMVFSSLSAVLPAYPRKSDYASGCVFADSYIRKWSKERKDLMVLNWCDWQETGMAYRVIEDRQEFASRRSFLHLRSGEGIAVFNYLLQQRYTNSMLLGNFQLAEKDDLEYLEDNKYFYWSPAGSVGESPVEAIIAEVEAPIPAICEAPLPEDSSTAARMALIWKEVLKVEKVALTDDFFDLGGQSLNGYTVLKQIEKIFEVELEIEDLFDYSIFSDLADHIDRLRAGREKIISYEHIPKLPLQDSYELSHAQKRLWVLYKSEGPGAAYNIPQVFFFKGVLDLGAFRDSLYALIERHEILRTTFKTINGEPRQIVHETKQFGFTLDYEDLSGLGGDKGETEAEKRVRALTSRVFDLEQGPLFIASLFKLGDERYAFVFNMHHIVSDGWSIDIILKDILAFYDSLVSKRTDQYPAPLKIQYKDFAAWQNRLINDEKVFPHRQYWLDRLSGEIPQISLPADFSRPEKRTYSGAMYESSLDSHLTGGLRLLNKAQGTTPFILLQAILKVLLYKISGQEDILVGIPVAGRVNEALNDQVGVYINNLVLRDRLYGDMTFVDFLQQVRKNTLEAYNHQEYPYDKLVEDLNIRYDKNRNPLYDVLLSMSNFNILEKGSKAAPGILHKIVSEEEMEIEHVFSKLDLSFFLDEREDDISFKIEYRKDLFIPKTIESMARAFKILAKSVIEEPGITLDALRSSLMSREEKSEHLEFEKYASGEVSEEF